VRAIALRLALPVALVAAAALGYAFAPGGIVRAVLVLPAALWVPGRGLLALFGIASGAGRWRTPLSVLFSLLTLIVGALVANAVGGSVPVTALPLVLAVVLLPAHIVGDPVDRPTVPTGVLARFGALFAVAALASGAVLFFVITALPSQPAAPYLEFALGGKYAQVSGTVPVTAGLPLHVPVSVTASGGAVGGLAVQAEINGVAVGAPVPVTGASAEVDVAAPAGCLNRLSLVLVKGKAELRSVDLYLKSSAGACAHG
jgi:hypothetical protein